MKFLVSFLLALVAGAASGNPIDDLERENPPLAGLLSHYASYQDGLEKYARQQGFREPYELRATVIQEVVHIDSAVHQGSSSMASITSLISVQSIGRACAIATLLR